MIDFTKFSNIISLTSYFNTEARGIPTICPCCGKSVEGENYMVGAHVELFIELASIKHKQFITPTCNICNSTYKESKYFHSFNIDVADLLEIEE